MREKVIKLLDFSRQWLPDQMELDDCPNNGSFNELNAQCEHCVQKPECSWLFNHGEYVELCEKPLPELVASLDLALWLTDAHNPNSEHKYPCSCDLCLWRTRAEKVLSVSVAADPSGLNL